MFIVFEGIDACGKGTQQEMLAQWFEKKGHRVIKTRVPGGCPNAEDIRALFKKERSDPLLPTTSLYLASAALHESTHTLIKPALAKGLVVICDRWFFSTFAYQHGGQGLPFGQVMSTILPAVDYTVPQLTFYLDIDETESLERRKKRGEPTDAFEALPPTFHRSVRACYLGLDCYFPGYYVIDGWRDEGSVHGLIVEEVQKRWPVL